MESEYLLQNKNEDALKRSQRILARNARKRKRRNCVLVCSALAFMAAVFGIMALYKVKLDPTYASPSSIIGRAKIAKSMVTIDSKTGAYDVDFDSGPTPIVPGQTTFAGLAEIMLHPWYEASLAAIAEDPAWKDDTTAHGIDPSNVGQVRKVMLIARDMLDVFSPVFPEGSSSKKDKSLWKKLRSQYRDGYQTLGHLKDLDGLTYGTDLLMARVNDVLTWKAGFIKFQKKYRIRHFLYAPVEKGGGIDPNGCYNHKASHLFWADFDQLPHGTDDGTKSLKSLATVQLTNSLGYLHVIRNYTTVMPVKHEENFHNLRKELRIFLDEYNLFGDVLVPPNSTTALWSGETSDHVPSAQSLVKEGAETDDVLAADLSTLNKAQKKLGHINDKWTAHQIYVSEGSHKSKQPVLAKETDEMWADFLVWEKKNELEQSIENVLERMQ